MKMEKNKVLNFSSQTALHNDGEGFDRRRPVTKVLRERRKISYLIGSRDVLD